MPESFGETEQRSALFHKLAISPFFWKGPFTSSLGAPIVEKQHGQLLKNYSGLV